MTHSDPGAAGYPRSLPAGTTPGASRSGAFPAVRIATVRLAGGVLAQGPVLHNGKADLHGLVSVDAGGKVASGRPVQSVRR